MVLTYVIGANVPPRDYQTTNGDRPVQHPYPAVAPAMESVKTYRTRVENGMVVIEA
jgi:hypothetical protein